MLSQSIAALYPLIRPLLFCVDPETTHHVTLSALNPVYRLGRTRTSNPIHLNIFLRPGGQKILKIKK